MHPPLSAPEVQRWTFSDGYSAAGRVWAPPDGRAARLILYLHGIQSHGGWYEWSASRLASPGAVVLLPDRRGSGMNADQRGDTPSAERWFADLDELCGWARERYGVSRVSLVMVSWGAKLGLAWAMRRAAPIDHLLLIGPGLFARVDIGPRARLAVAWALLSGARTRPFPIPLQDPALFTDNPAARAFIAADPLKLEHVTARFLYQSRRLDRWVRALRRNDLPARVTALLAGEDRIADTPRTRAWLDRTGGTAARVQIFQEESHTLEFSRDREGLENALLAWRAGLDSRPETRA